MAERILGPWVGAVTERAATLTAFIAKGAPAQLTLYGPEGAVGAHAPVERVRAEEKWEVVRYELDGLAADAEYAYEMSLAGGGEAVRGGFRTFPVPGAPASFRFLCGGDAGGGIFSEYSNHRVFDYLRERELFDAAGRRQALFFLHLGDLHYDDTDSEGVESHLKRYRRVWKNARQANFFRRTPVAYVWDDHDFCGNGSSVESAGRTAAQRAYRVGFPHYPLAAGGEAGPIHQAFTVGRVRFLLTDTRSARATPGTAEGAAKTILGAGQKAWLKEELRSGRDRYALTIWVNAAPWLGAPCDVPGNADGWANYRTERAELGDFILANGIENLLMLSADAHMLAFDDGTHNQGETGRGGFPIFHAAPLDRLRSRKGGDNYSHGAFPGSSGQYGVIEIFDDGRAPRARYALTGKKMGAPVIVHAGP